MSISETRMCDLDTSTALRAARALVASSGVMRARMLSSASVSSFTLTRSRRAGWSPSVPHWKLMTSSMALHTVLSLRTRASSMDLFMRRER